MIVALVPIIFTAITGYYTYIKFVSKKLDCPNNNENIKGLEKSEIKTHIKDNETKQKGLKAEIKTLEEERKDILKGSETDKADQAQAKLEEKNEKLKELEEIETILDDLKVVDKGSYWRMIPNKLTWNNGLWMGGFIIALVIVWKLTVQIFKSLFRSIGFEE